MASRAIEPITLPWKRPERGVSVAEMGASFRVEQREDGWHCTVNVGRRAEVLATGLRRLRDAQCRAEAHAATLPVVAAAREKLAAEERKGASPAKQRTASTQTDPSPAGPVTAPGVETPPLAFEQVSDGCICGKIEGGTWVADPGGGVSVPTGTDLAVAQEICRVATAHFTARRSATTPAKAAAKASTKPAGERGGRKSKPTTAKPVMAKPVAAPEKPAAKAAPVEKPAPAKKAKLPKKAKSKPAKEPAAPTSASARKQAKAPRRVKGKAASKRATAKPTTPEAPAGRKPSATKEQQAATPTPAKAAAKVKKPAARRRKVGKRGKASAPEEKQVAAPTPPAKEEKVSKRPAKNSKPAKDACGCVTWAAVDGKIRGEAKHGTFVVEPEGKRHALYFYGADGQSRHLESGEAGKLRKVAEEMAARGQPVLRAAASGVDDAALMRAFLGDDA